MLANFFGKSKPINFIVISALFLCFYILGVLNTKTDFQLHSLPLILFLFSIVNFINLKNGLTFDNSFAFLFFVFLVGVFPKTTLINQTFFANLTILLFLRKVYSLQSLKKNVQKLFDAGLWLGISFLIEPFTVLFAVLLYVSIYLHKKFTIQNVLIPIIGFLPPIILFFTYCFWHDKLDVFRKLFTWFTSYNFENYFTMYYIIFAGFVGVFTLVSIALKTGKLIRIKTTFRLSWFLILLHLTIATGVFVLVKDKNGSEFLYLFFPTAIILANGIELYQKKWIADVVLVVFVIGIIISNLI